MERYKQVYSSKWQSQYTEEFKRHVVNEFLKGDLTRREVERKFQIGNSRLTYWLRDFGITIKKRSIASFHSTMPTSKAEKDKQSESTQELKKQLEDALLLAESYKKMIDKAEEQLNINIRKKSNTK